MRKEFLVATLVIFGLEARAARGDGPATGVVPAPPPTTSAANIPPAYYPPPYVFPPYVPPPPLDPVEEARLRLQPGDSWGMVWTYRVLGGTSIALGAVTAIGGTVAAVQTSHCTPSTCGDGPPAGLVELFALGFGLPIAGLGVIGLVHASRMSDRLRALDAVSVVDVHVAPIALGYRGQGLGLVGRF